MRPGRNHQFDLARIVLALLVMLSHAAELTDGNTSREILSVLTDHRMTFGVFAVDGFFLLSGFLITASWLANPELLNFIRKRALRILPGYAVAVLLSVVAVGMLASAVPHFFAELAGPGFKKFSHSVLTLSTPVTPPVLAGLSFPLVNGSMWTIAYEFRCYLLIALLGVTGLLRRPWLVGVLTLVCVVLAADATLMARLNWPSTHLDVALGSIRPAMRMTSIFLVGACFFLFRERIRFRPLYALAACVVLLGVRVLLNGHLETALALCGGYLLFYLGSLELHGLDWMRRVPDISYGVYLYGWPVEALLIWHMHWSPWLTFAAAVPVCAALGWLSWHLVERPALTLKRRATAPLPAS